jgi:hypothetical protein
LLQDESISGKADEKKLGKKKKKKKRKGVKRRGGVPIYMVKELWGDLHSVKNMGLSKGSVREVMKKHQVFTEIYDCRVSNQWLDKSLWHYRTAEGFQTS